ncbi:hypothetical protein HMPREF3152_07735 [Actinomyces sp. HMSC06A08]|uniref:Uncharacterized protein n=1 Tax=Winkia neuii TaxID=33007 RepID=A0A2I1IQM7_9ACTO|nr:hypothetical protein [Winkia neuii]OFK01704.1 hypothetical protein HMPREF2835_08800 [Actinomyces sp. HMSC072A03]OFT54746.1 hypothetical protein HMPREF3152_07735 [Actinomyces sp. HMSC06A08]KWZ74481.1 hypothetical protein HMPREF3198_01040 [Winkia neuii]MDK8100526.1 hypothetical protein [Winkia neuii]PKY73419.1 hypothetical protein CYJ19_02210 [Winkia neuii]
MISCPPVETRTKRVLLVVIAALLVLLPLRAFADSSPLQRQSGHLVVIGTSGLRWQDVDFSDPRAARFAKFAEEGTLANLVARSTAAVSCPADGWLSLGAGQRATLSRAGGKCYFPRLSSKTVAGWGPLTDGVIPAGQVGLGFLRSSLKQAGKSVAAVGPGAGLALADKRGHLDAPPLDNGGDLAATVASAASENEVTIVDAGAVDPAHAPQVGYGLNPTPQNGYPTLDSEPSKTKLAQAKVRQISQILEALPKNTQVLLASFGEGNAVPHLQLFAMQTDASSVGLAKSGSLRRDGLVQTADITQTILQTVGLEPAENAPGAQVWTAGRTGKMSFTDRLDSLLDRSAKTDRARVCQPAFFILWFTLCGVTIVAGMLLSVRGRKGTAIEKVPKVLAQLAGAMPLAALLANLIPTWRFSTASTPTAVLVFLTAILATAGFLVLTAHGIAHWLRPHVPASFTRPLNAPIVLAALTLTVFAWVIAVRAPLQLDSPTGTTTIAGNRFFGSGNTEFTLMAVCFVVLAAWSANAWVTTIMGLALAVIDGFPTMGADFGGPPAILFTTVLLATWVRGKKVRLRHVAAALFAAAIGTAFFGVVDYLQAPQARTHLGRFVASLVEGNAWPIIARKAEAAWLTVGGSAGTLVAAAVFLVAIGAIAYVLYSPRYKTRVLPFHRNVLLSTIILLVSASLINDSGMLILTIGLLLEGSLICGGLFHKSAWSPSGKIALSRAPARRQWPTYFAAATACTILAGIALAATTTSPTDSKTHHIQAAKTPVVAIFTEGIRWEKVTPQNAPTLYRRASQGAAANLVPLSLSGPTCPIDSWLAINAGQRAWRNSLGGYEICTSLQKMPEVSQGQPRPALKRWDYYSKAMAQMTNHPTLGALGEAVERNKVRVRAIGPGAAAALANARGIPQGTLQKAPSNNGELARKLATDLHKYDLTLVDANAISTVQNPDRAAAATRRAIRDATDKTGNPPTEVQVRPQLRSLANPEVKANLNADSEDAPDLPEASFSIKTNQESATNTQRAQLVASQSERQLARLEAAVRAVPPNARLLVVSSADFGVRSYMQTALAAGPGVGTAGLARSSSVRQDGIIQLPDVAATLGQWLGFDMPGSGSAITNQIGLHHSSLADRHDYLTDQADRAFAMRDVRAGFYAMVVTYAVAVILILAALSVAMAYGVHIAPSARLLARFCALTLASIPLATLALPAFKWWHFQDTHGALNGGTMALAGLLAAACLAGPWREGGRPALSIAVATAVAIAADVATGTNALIDSPFGFNSLAAARFYGVGNETFSLLSVGALLLSGWVGTLFTRRWAKALAVVATSLPFLLIDAAPSLGADFGGILAFIPGICVLVILLAGYQLKLRWILPIGFVMAFGASFVALLDWLRPPSSRTHLGRFVQSALDGDLMPIVVGKLQTNLRLLGISTLRWVVLAALVALVVWFCLSYPRLRGRAPALPAPLLRMLRPAYKKFRNWLGKHPKVTGGKVHLLPLPAWFRPCAWALLVTQILAFGLNDSGIVLPGVAAIMALPLAADTIIDSLRSRP